MSSDRTRTALRSDVAAIFSVLTEIAPEIPVRLDTKDRQERIFDLVGKCCEGALSWVGLDTDNKVVGFLLGQDYSIDFSGIKFSGIELLYGGVLKASRGCGQFSNLLNQAKALRTPLYAVVKDANSGSMAARLIKTGFTKQGSSLFPDETAFIWIPQTS